jgi:hypothetical protein
VVRERRTPKPVTRTVISSSGVGGSSGFEPMIRDVSRAKDEVERQCCGGGLEFGVRGMVGLFLAPPGLAKRRPCLPRIREILLFPPLFPDNLHRVTRCLLESLCPVALHDYGMTKENSAPSFSFYPQLV